MTVYSRSGSNIKYKFYQFLIPTVLGGLATSLNEFVDSIVVSQLLGSEAMGMVGMASPVMFAFGMVTILLGIGGSAVYAEYAGKHEKDKAEGVFSVVIVFSVLIAVILAITGMVFIDPLANFMCRSPELISQFKPYTVILLLSGVLIIPVVVIAFFSPAFGSPQIGTMVTIISNATNLLMDIVYIRFFDTGLKGAAMATFSGNLIGLFFILIMIFSKKLAFPYRKTGPDRMALLFEVVRKGAPASISQLGFLIKVSFCNQLAMRLGGVQGITTFTLCIQTLSVVSIGASGVLDSMIPIGAALTGQGDHKGLKTLMKTVLTVQLIANMVFTVFFLVFPQSFCYLFNCTGEEAAAAVTGIRIFSLMFVFRGYVLIFLYYFQVINRKIYASVISCVDGFAGLIPIALILTDAFGINGLWMAFPVLSILMLAVIVPVNLCIAKKSNGKYSGIMLYEAEDSNISVYDATFTVGKDLISDFIISLQDFCNKNINNKKTSMIVALASEEMLSYTCGYTFNKAPVEEIDIMLKILPEEIMIDIRSLGEPI
nr:hypothetical protein [Lachnospiraceae bacterium]